MLYCSLTSAFETVKIGERCSVNTIAKQLFSLLNCFFGWSAGSEPDLVAICCRTTYCTNVH